MRHPSSTVRRFARAVALCALALFLTDVTAARAQTLAPEAVEAFLTDAALLGADRATVARVGPRDGAIVADDVRMEWVFPIDPTLPDVPARVVVEIPQIVLEGLAARGDGHAASRIHVPTLNIALRGAEGDGDVIRLTLSDYGFTDARWSAFPRIVADPTRPASRFAPLVDWLYGVSYALNSVERVDATFDAPELEQTLSYGPLAFGPVEDGRAAEVRFGPITVDQSGTVTGLDGTSEIVPLTVRYGEVVARDLDLSGVAALLTGTRASPDAADVVPMVGEMRLAGVSLDGEDDVSFSMGDVVIEGMAVDTARGPLLEKFDPILLAALAGEEPEPLDLAQLAFDLYGAFRYRRYAIEDISLRGPDFTASLDEIVTEDVSSSGIARAQIADLALASAEGRFSLDSVELTGLAFPDAEAFLAIAALAEAELQPTTAQMLAITPTFERLRIDDLEIASAQTGRMALDLMDLRFDDHVNAIPTRAELSVSGLEVPAAMMPDERSQMVLAALDVDPLQLDGDLSLTFDETSERLSLAHEMDAPRIGRLSLSGALTSVPRRLFEDPDAAPALFGLASIDRLEMRYDDAGLTAFLLDMIAQQSGISAAELAAGLAAQARILIASRLSDPRLADEVAGTINAFLADPRSLSLSVRPPTPIAIAQVIGAAMAAPQSLPQLLNLTVSANE